jgi:hypothetical protein
LFSEKVVSEQEGEFRKPFSKNVKIAYSDSLLKKIWQHLSVSFRTIWSSPYPVMGQFCATLAHTVTCQQPDSVYVQVVSLTEGMVTKKYLGVGTVEYVSTLM